MRPIEIVFWMGGTDIMLSVFLRIIGRVWHVLFVPLMTNVICYLYACDVIKYLYACDAIKYLAERSMLIKKIHTGSC